MQFAESEANQNRNPPRLRAVLFNTTARDGHHGCTLVCRRIDELAAGAGIDIALKLGLLPEEAPVPLETFDLILVNGEGSLHSSNRNARRIAEIGQLATRIERPAYLINSVYEDNDGEIAAGVRGFHSRFVRDTFSANEMAAAGLDATVVPDLSLTWEPALPATAIPGKLIVGDSVKHAETAELYDLCRRQGGRFLSMRSRPPFIERYPRRNLSIVAKHWLRQPFRYLLPPGAKRAAGLNRINDFDRFIAELSTASFIVTGRFHMFTLALDLEIPVVAVSSNTRKVEALSADIGLTGRTFGTVKALGERLNGRQWSDFAFSPEEISAIRRFKTGAIERARAMFERVERTAHQRSNEE